MGSAPGIRPHRALNDTTIKRRRPYKYQPRFYTVSSRLDRVPAAGRNAERACHRRRQSSRRASRGSPHRGRRVDPTLPAAGMPLAESLAAPARTRAATAPNSPRIISRATGLSSVASSLAPAGWPRSGIATRACAWRYCAVSLTRPRSRRARTGPNCRSSKSFARPPLVPTSGSARRRA